MLLRPANFKTTRACTQRSQTCMPPRTTYALTVLIFLFAFCANTPGYADDDDTAGFFKFKNSDFFDIVDVKKEDKREKKEEKEDDKLRDDRDNDWQTRPTNPKETYTETFMDTDFSKHSFSDLDMANDLNALADADVTSKRRDFGSRSDDDAKRTDEDHSDDRDKRREEYRKRMRDEDYRKFRDLTKIDDSMLHDGVPTPMDRRQNGGFELLPGNGYIVPYKLNGWIEIDRKLPWEAAQ